MIQMDGLLFFWDEILNPIVLSLFWAWIRTCDRTWMTFPPAVVQTVEASAVDVAAPAAVAEGWTWSGKKKIMFLKLEIKINDLDRSVILTQILVAP